MGSFLVLKAFFQQERLQLVLVVISTTPGGIEKWVDYKRIHKDRR